MLADNGTGRVLSVVRTAGGGRLYRMRVTNANPGVSGLVLARNWDGTNESGAEVPVKAVQGHPPGGELYAMQVVGNTDASYSGQPVAWLEWLVLPVSTIPYRVVQVIDTAGRLGVESVALE
jgi:hypothetical protein